MIGRLMARLNPTTKVRCRRAIVIIDIQLVLPNCSINEAGVRARVWIAWEGHELIQVAIRGFTRLLISA
jgi:hypothetical protein